MKSCVLFLLSVILVALVVDEVTSTCCKARGGGGWWLSEKAGICGDCTQGTPYCGYYRCNWLGCDCGGGCRSGSCFSARSITRELQESPAEIFSKVDVNGDSMIDKTEFFGAHAVVKRTSSRFYSRGLSEEAYLGHEFVKMDIDGDGMISPAEFDEDLE